MMDEASRIVDSFSKWDDQKWVKKQIKHAIIANLDLSLVKPVTERFMDLAKIKFQ